METGVISTVNRRVFKVLRREGVDDTSALTLYTSYDDKVKDMKGWCIDASGKKSKVGNQDVLDMAVSDNLYSDARIKKLVVPDVKQGCVVGYEWEIESKPLSMEDVIHFQHEIPVFRSIINVTMPSSYQYNADWVNWKAENPRNETTEDDKKSFNWELMNIPPIEDEPSMPAYRAIAGWLGLRFKSSRAINSYFSNWNEIGKGIGRLTANCVTPDSAIEQETKKIVSSTTNSSEKLHALARFIQNEIRYVSIQIGIGGFRPHPAPEVFTKRYGDCKDKVTLLASMLRSSGILAYYILINTNRGYITPDSPPYLYSFNHAIIAIKIPDDVPQEMFSSIISHPKLGKLLIFDPTDENTPLGLLPQTLQGNTGLLISEDGGELVKIPFPDPGKNCLKRKGTFTILADGSLQGEIEETRKGYFANDSREALKISDIKERREYLEGFLGLFFSGFTLKEMDIRDLENHNKDLTVKYSIHVPSYAKFSGNMLLIRPCVLGNKTEVLENNDRTPRRYPVELESTALQLDEFSIRFPEGWKMNQPITSTEINTGFASYRSEAKIDSNLIVYHREYKMMDPFIPTSKFTEAVKFFRTIERDQRQNILLEK